MKDGQGWINPRDKAQMRRLQAELNDAMRYASLVIVAGPNPDHPDELDARTIAIKPRAACMSLVARILREVADDLDTNHGPHRCAATSGCEG